MGSALGVKGEGALQAPMGLGNRLVGMQIHFFVLDALPQALDKEVDQISFS
jgi:hypothetical protein